MMRFKACTTWALLLKLSELTLALKLVEKTLSLRLKPKSRMSTGPPSTKASVDGCAIVCDLKLLV